MLVKFLDTKNTDIEGQLRAPKNNKGNFGPTQYLPQAPVSDCFFSKFQRGSEELVPLLVYLVTNESTDVISPHPPPCLGNEDCHHVLLTGPVLGGVLLQQLASDV